MRTRKSRILYLAALLLFVPTISVCQVGAAKAKIVQVVSQNQGDNSQIVQWEDGNIW